MAFNEYLVGKRERMTWIVETSYGTGGTMANGEVVGYNCIIEPSFSQGWQEILSGGADSREVEDRVVGPKILPYTMTFSPVNWRWLKYLMSVSDGDDAGVKTHTFTVGNAIKSYKLEWAKRHTTDHVITLVGNVMTSAVIAFAKATGAGIEGLMTVAASCFAQDLSQGSSVSSVSALTGTPFQYRMVKLTLDGSEITEVNNGELTIDNGISQEDSRYCNSTLDEKVGEPIPTVFRMTGRMNVNMKDKTYYDLFAARTYVAGTNTILIDRDGSGDDQILFTLTDFVLDPGVAPTNLDGVTNVDLVFAAAITSVVARDAVTTY